jgi:hypothetical protein
MYVFKYARETSHRKGCEAYELDRFGGSYQFWYGWFGRLKSAEDRGFTRLGAGWDCGACDIAVASEKELGADMATPVGSKTRFERP